jgi:hypothetical protein
MQRSEPRFGTATNRLRHVARVALALLLVASGVGLIADAPARAQGTALLSLSSVTPDSVLFYGEISLDTGSAQLQQLDDLLLRLGSEDSLIDAINESADETAADVDLAGAEIAIAVLPAALESGADASTELVDAANTGELLEDLTETGVGADTKGVVVIIRPVDITAFESSARESEGIPTETETYLGAEIVTYDDAEGDPSSYVFDGDFAFAGTNADDLKPFLDAARGETAVLSELEAFQTASDLLSQDRVAFAFTNGPALFDAIEAQAEAQDEPLVDEAMTMFEAYGEYSGLVVSAAPEGIRLDSVLVPEDGSADAVASGTAADLELAERMPIDTVLFASGFDLGQSAAMNLIGIGLISAVVGGLSDFETDEELASPTPVSVDDMYEQIEMLLGFNLKLDFIDQLSGPFALGLWNIDAEIPSAALVSGVEDATVLGDTLGTVSQLIQAAGQGETNVTSLSVNGGTLDHVEFESDGSTIDIDYGVVGDEFVVSLGGGAEAVMNGPTESLADSSTYVNALSLLPAEHQAIYFVDIAKLDAASGMSTRSTADEQGGLISSLLGTPVAGSTTVPDALAAATYVEDGYTFTSGILIVP